MAPATSAPLTHGLGLRTWGRFWKVIGVRPRCSAATSPSWSRLNDWRGAGPEPGEIDAEGVGVVALRVEAKAPPHCRDRHLAADREVVAANDDLDAGPEHRPGLRVAEHAPAPREPPSASG